MLICAAASTPGFDWSGLLSNTLGVLIGGVLAYGLGLVAWRRELNANDARWEKERKERQLDRLAVLVDTLVSEAARVASSPAIRERPALYEGVDDAELVGDDGPLSGRHQPTPEFHAAMSIAQRRALVLSPNLFECLSHWPQQNGVFTGYTGPHLQQLILLLQMWAADPQKFEQDEHPLHWYDIRWNPGPLLTPDRPTSG